MSSLADDARQFAPRLVDLTLDDARRVAAEFGYIVRVIVVDGVEQLHTEEFRSNRINVGIEGSRVVTARTDDELA